MLAWIWCAHFCAKIYFILTFLQNLNHFDCQLLEILEWRLCLKFSAHLQASIQPFTWARVAGPTSYLSQNFELPKCWTSEVPHPNCPISNCPTTQTVDIGVSLWLPMFSIIFPTFLRTGISPEFTWTFIYWVSAGYFPGVFSPWPKKKRHREKSLQKMFLQSQTKISVHIVFHWKMQFLQRR